MEKQKYDDVTLSYPVCLGCNEVIINLCKKIEGKYFHNVYCYKKFKGENPND